MDAVIAKSALVGEVDKSVAPTRSDPEQDREDYNRLTVALQTTVALCVEHAANLGADGP